MENIDKALQNLDQSMSELEQPSAIPFKDFLKVLSNNPNSVVRNVFQTFYDMIKANVGEAEDEYPDDPAINFQYYDCNKLFVEESDHPFFADRLFAQRFMKHVEDLKRGAQQNKIFIFDGPPGCGKSTFLNNLLRKFEDFSNTDEGLRYETVWRLDRKMLLDNTSESDDVTDLDKLKILLSKFTKMDGGELFRGPEPENGGMEESRDPDSMDLFYNGHTHHPSTDYIEIRCPSHDNPVLMVPKRYRRKFFDELFLNDEFKWKLFTEKEYEWVFKDNPCTICCSLYDALLARLKNPLEVFDMLYAGPYRFNRRLGEGISVFNPGDRPMRQNILSNQMLQNRINHLLKDSNQVKFIFSRYAKTNNGIYALMDIKSNNIERLIELHNIISEGVHKVEEIEENVNSLFIALMNPEDKKNIQGLQSFSDRIEYINIPYVLDLNTEVEIYRNIFGKRINESFIPRVLHNFARVIISTRLKQKSTALSGWIKDPKRYKLYCDESLLLLKMEIYTGNIPKWLSEEDRKGFTAQRKRDIIAESEDEGDNGLSGRDAIKIFSEFYSKYAREDRLINMSQLYSFFTEVRLDLKELVPKGFLDSMISMYDYMILQEVKESLYYYNEEQISMDLQNYLFAVNFEPGTVETCSFTKDRLEITEEYLTGIEKRLLGAGADQKRHHEFRKDTQKEYATKALTQEIMLQGLPVTETELYRRLYERYVYNLKEKVLEPFLDNENFRQGIKDYGEETFRTYDKRIRDDVTFLIDNLCNKNYYTQLGAKEVCIYVIDNDLAKKYSTT